MKRDREPKSAAGDPGQEWEARFGDLGRGDVEAVKRRLAALRVVAFAPPGLDGMAPKLFENPERLQVGRRLDLTSVRGHDEQACVDSIVVEALEQPASGLGFGLTGERDCSRNDC